MASATLLFLTAYLGFALPLHAWPLLLLAFVLAGSGIGLAETAESTLFAQATPEHLRGSGFGLLGAIQSGGALAIVGLIWSLFSPTLAFLYAAAWMSLTLLSSRLIKP